MSMLDELLSFSDSKNRSHLAYLMILVNIFGLTAYLEGASHNSKQVTQETFYNQASDKQLSIDDKENLPVNDSISEKLPLKERRSIEVRDKTVAGRGDHDEKNEFKNMEEISKTIQDKVIDITSISSEKRGNTKDSSKKPGNTKDSSKKLVWRFPK
ncbi:MAG: hypothetical protein ACOX15_10290 [Tepidanaerobacteraceae bacterium]